MSSKILAFKNNSHSYKFEQQLNEHMRTFRPLDVIMQILCYQKKVRT